MRLLSWRPWTSSITQTQISKRNIEDEEVSDTALNLSKRAGSAESNEIGTGPNTSGPRTPQSAGVSQSPANVTQPAVDPEVARAQRDSSLNPPHERPGARSDLDVAIAGDLSQDDIDAAIALRDFLTRKDTVRMLVLPPQIITHQERDILHDLSEHFPSLKRKRAIEDLRGGTNANTSAVQRADTHKNPNRSQPDAYRNVKPRRQLHGNYSGQLAPLVNKTYLRIPAVLQDHLKVNGTEPLAFLEHEVTLHFHAHRMSNEESLGERFAACYSFATNLQNRNEMDRMRWCFTLLMFYDFMQLLCPGTTGGRTGHVMVDTLADFLKQTFRNNPEQYQEACDNISKWNRWGMKLNYLCQEFGEGAIFFLSQHFSDDFLERKFPLDGEVVKRAFANLRSLGLRQKADEASTTELGIKLREVMIAPLRVKLSDLLD